MDSNNWRQPSPTEQSAMDGVNEDWRSQLQADSRPRVVDKIMDTLRHHLPSSGHEGVQDLNKLATRFEEDAYHAATDQFDYLRRISLRMLTMESNSDPSDPMLNAMPSNSAGMGINFQDLAISQSMQPQVQNQGQSLSILTESNQPTYATALQPHMQQQTQQNLFPSAQLQFSHGSVMQNSSVMQPSTVSGLLNQPSSIQQSSQSSLQQHQQSNLPSMYQPQLNSQTVVVGMLPQQQQMLGSQSAFLDSTAQTGNSDAQTEVYQKIKFMKDLYFADMHDIYQKICSKLQQHEPISQQAKSDVFERLKLYKSMIERILHCLQISKSSAQHFHKDKLASLERQILNILNTHRLRKPGPPFQQGQILPSHMQSLQQNQQPHLQIPQNQSHENGVNSQVQSVNVQGFSVPTMQPGNLSRSSFSGVTSSQPNFNLLQPGSNLDNGQGNALGSIQKNPLSVPQQIKVLKDLYFAEVHEIYQKVCSKVQELESLSQQARPDNYDPTSQQAKSDVLERLKLYKNMIERILHCLQISESNAHHFHEDKLGSLKKQILNILNVHKHGRTLGPPFQLGQTASLSDSSK